MATAALTKGSPDPGLVAGVSIMAFLFVTCTIALALLEPELFK